jgi:four helix bundle protein
MGVRDFKELVAWRLADELRVVVIEFCKRPMVVRQLRYRDQLTDAASSAPRNIAEGFGRFRHREFAQMVRIAKGSEHEVLDLLTEARHRGFLTSEEFDAHERLARRAMGAAAGLIKYLEKTPDPTI